MRLTFATAVFLSFPAILSAACPAPPDIGPELGALIEQARAAPNEGAGQQISGEMWKLWLKAPDTAAQEVLDTGMRKRASYDFLGAIEQYSELIAYCPTYAEGYNQRAFIYFLQKDYAKALIDLDKALELSPNHVGVQSGRALTLMHLDRLQEARTQLIAALDNNPWLSERYLMLEGGPLSLVGKDI